ncbi:uracil-DNA glycosylase family 4 [Oxalobacteraceae bacterium GrIS 1.11]
MKQAPGRHAVFLEEMGLGPLWRLRRGVAKFDAEAAPERLVVETIAPAAPVAVSPPIAAPAVPHVAVPVASATLMARAPVAAPAVADQASTAWFDDAPAPPAPTPVSDQEIATMDWAALNTAVAKCTRCDLCRGRKGVVLGRGEQRAAWMIVGAAPNRADEKAAQALSGDAGKLLDNMLLAMGLDGQRDVYVTNLVKCRPFDAVGAERAPTQEEVAACRPFLERELALTGSSTILTLGRSAASGLIRAPAAARGTVRRLGAIAVVATYHPEDMLRQGADKAKAWPDLCLAMSAHAEPGN